MKVPSNSCFPCRLAFCSFCFGSFGDSSGSLRQHKKAKARHSKTTNRPAKNVKMLDSRKHHHFRSVKHFSSSPRSDTLAAVVTYATYDANIKRKKNWHKKYKLIRHIIWGELFLLSPFKGFSFINRCFHIFFKNISWNCKAKQSKLRISYCTKCTYFLVGFKMHLHNKDKI